MQTQQSWTFDEVKSLFELPFMDLLYRAQSAHRENFNANEMYISSLLSVKTGSCKENCAYCPQSSHYETGLNKESFLSQEEVIAAAKKAKKLGASRFCVSASGSLPQPEDFQKYLAMIKAVKKIGLSACATLGELSLEQVQQLEQAGLDYYNHNIDTSPEFYHNIVTTRTFADRLQTINHLANSNIKICCGVIIGMGEAIDDRNNMLLALAKLPRYPDVIPINRLIKIKNTPLEHASDIDNFDYIRMLAVTRIIFPRTIVALAAGRNEMSEEMQALCVFAGANAMHVGEKLLVTPLPDISKDKQLLDKLGVRQL